MMNGDFTPVTVPGMEEKQQQPKKKKKNLKEIPPKSATNGKLETDAYRAS